MSKLDPFDCVIGLFALSLTAMSLALAVKMVRWALGV